MSVTDNAGNAITDTSNVALVNPYRYRSYYYDSETSLYYLNSRYYNPETGRFVNADEVMMLMLLGNLSTDFNLFAYCKNSVSSFSDYYGYWYEEYVYITYDQVEDFARKIDRYIASNTKSWTQKFLYGLGREIMGSIKAYKIGSFLSIVGFISGLFPKLNNELATIRRVTDELRSATRKIIGIYYGVFLLQGSHNTQYKLEAKKNTKGIAEAIIEFRNGNTYYTLRNFLISMGFALRKRNVAWKYSYK